MTFPKHPCSYADLMNECRPICSRYIPLPLLHRRCVSAWGALVEPLIIHARDMPDVPLQPLWFVNLATDLFDYNSIVNTHAAPWLRAWRDWVAVSPERIDASLAAFHLMAGRPAGHGAFSEPGRIAIAQVAGMDGALFPGFFGRLPREARNGYGA